MSTLLTLTSENFDATIAEGVTLVDFWAPRCAPCMMLMPIIENHVAPALAGRAKVAKVNVDEARDLVMKLSFKAIPTLMIFKNGQLVQQMTGLQPADALVKAVEAAM